MTLSAPKPLDQASSEALQSANERLRAEVAAHRRTLADLEAAHAGLEQQVAERVEDIRVLNARFAAGLRNSSVTLIEQDEALRYTWVFNPPAGMDPEEMVGRCGQDYTDARTADTVASVRRDALASGEMRQIEIQVERGGQVFWYLARIQPTRLRDGSIGVITSSVDITAQKQHQAHLQLITRELNHRSKNLLTIVQSLARQTASGLDVPAAFLRRLSERLGSLASAHDVLVQGDWRGADLRAVIEGQLKHQIQAFGDRIGLTGERVELAPEMAHYVGLAVHELGANAAKHGALSNADGQVDVNWLAEPDGKGGAMLRLEWLEAGGPPTPQTAPGGFGRTILEVLTPKALAGAAEFRFGDGGVSWTLTAPLTRAL